ncbi:unnamed protein product [Peronospora belbahrii]|uniref:BZIP domain-containing protein n=1 Tax=Peronospora belbahrii TaxID=622444 RepID=A0AAU9KIP3_9STRA|nr:unnamed protein product [Peronospora belbahrii]
MPIVLPSIGPLYTTTTTSGSRWTYFTYENEEQREQYEEDMARYFGVPLPSCIRRKPEVQEEEEAEELTMSNLRTPTSGHLLSTSFPPSTSPMKKDGASSNKMTLPLLQKLQLDSPTSPSDVLNEMEHSSEEEKKLRVSRERNRLHAQRTRIRKRELLESLKERIEALQDEFQLLKQAYDFHTTAVCLLKLGNVHDLPCVYRLEQVGIDAMEDRDKDGQLCESVHTTCSLHESDYDDEMHEHGMDVNSRTMTTPACIPIVLVCSKEERERVRRERNRLHARRARLRKKLVLEKSQQAVHDLRERNDRLRSRLSALVSSIYGLDACLDDPDATS